MQQKKQILPSKLVLNVQYFKKEKNSLFLLPYIADMRGKSPPWYTLIMNMIIKMNSDHHQISKLMVLCNVCVAYMKCIE